MSARDDRASPPAPRDESRDARLVGDPSAEVDALEDEYDDATVEGPPQEASMSRVSDDDDLDAGGGGLRNTALSGAYESMARRADLSRRLEELLTDVQEWAQDDGTEQALWIAESLSDAFEQLDTPPEDTDGRPDVE